MLKLVLSNRFKKDLELARKRGCNFEELENVVTLLMMGKRLPERYRDHKLSGNF